MNTNTTTHTRLRSMVLCALFAAVTAVCSQIAVPMPWGVPINLALFAVYLAGALLGPVYGTVSMVVYAALAAIGVPVMAGLIGGPAAIFGKTGGYVLGYIPAALIVGLLTRRNHGVWRTAAAMLPACAACYIFGTVWFMVVTGTGLWQSLAWCVLPYLPGDAIKLALAAFLTPRLKKQISTM